MKRSEIKVGDDLALQDRKYSSPEHVRVVAVDGYHLRAKGSFYSRIDRRPEPLELPDGSTLHGRVVPADEVHGSNCVIVRRVAEDGTLLNPQAVRAQALIGYWDEVKAERDASAKASAEYQQKETAKKRENLAHGRELMAWLESKGAKPATYISDWDLQKGKVTITLADLQRIVNLVP